MVGLLLSLALGSTSAQKLVFSAATYLTNAFKELAPLFDATHFSAKVASADSEVMRKADAQQLVTADIRKILLATAGSKHSQAVLSI